MLCHVCTAYELASFLGVKKWLFAHHGIAYVRLGVDDQPVPMSVCDVETMQGMFFCSLGNKRRMLRCRQFDPLHGSAKMLYSVLSGAPSNSIPIN